MNTKKSIIVTIVSAIALTILGAIVYDKILTCLLPKADNVKYIVTNIDAQFSVSVWFGAVWGLFPIVLYSIWLLSKTEGLKRKIFSIGLILLFMLAAIVIRYLIIKSTASKANQLTSEIITIPFDVTDLRYSLYMFLGLITGGLTTTLILNSGKK